LTEDALAAALADERAALARMRLDKLPDPADAVLPGRES
jgi:hypothetical protein